MVRGAGRGKNKVIFFHSYAASRHAENLPQAFMTVSALGGATTASRGGQRPAAIYTWDAGDLVTVSSSMQAATTAISTTSVLRALPGRTAASRATRGGARLRKAATSPRRSGLTWDRATIPPSCAPTRPPTTRRARDARQPASLVPDEPNFMQTRGNLPTAIEAMRAADTRISLEIVLADRAVRRHHPAGGHALGGQRRRGLGASCAGRALSATATVEAAQRASGGARS